LKKYEDDTVREMANERFREIERLSKKIKEYFERGGKTPAGNFIDNRNLS
jgi:hypothetical protein